MFDFAGFNQGSFPLAGAVRGRGIAVDSDGQHMWMTWLGDGGGSDHQIHELDRNDGPEVRAIADPGGEQGEGVRSLISMHLRVICGQSTVGDSSSTISIQRRVPYAEPPALRVAQLGDVVARPADRGGERVLLLSTDGLVEGTTDLVALAPSNCAVVGRYGLPAEIVGFDEDPRTGHLVGQGALNPADTIYDFGTAPYVTATAVISTARQGTGYDPVDGAILQDFYLLQPGSDLSLVFTPGPSLSITPSFQTKEVGKSAEFTATLRDPDGEPLPGIPLVASVDDGPSMGATVRCAQTCTTDSEGRAVFRYRDQAAGTDSLSVFADLDGDGIHGSRDPAATAGAAWRSPTVKRQIVVSFGDSIPAGAPALQMVIRPTIRNPIPREAGRNARLDEL